MDKNDFFREVTLRICGNLEIEEGLRSCIEYLARYMPADCIYLERYEKDLGAMRVYARASKEKGERMDVLIPLLDQAQEAITQMRQAWWAGRLPPVTIFNRPEEEPVTRCILEALGEPSSSAMSLPLMVEDHAIGILALLAEGNDRFEDNHAQLFATIKEPFFVAMSNTLKHREVLELKDLLADDNRYLHNELRRLSGDEIIGMNFGLKEVMKKVRHVATLGSPVLLLGETGTGKDVIANAIHYLSPRQNSPFIKVNCGAIPETLIDSELFGHEKGAFTGAISQKRGYFERADKGTIFLDEIGELPSHAQVRLLRVLQDKKIERIGGTKTLHLDIRVIAATNRDLQEMVNTNLFRKDLWFRLNVFPIQIPPVCQRKTDIPALLQYFITQKAKELKLSAIPKIAPGAIDHLMEYDWPGNVRELQNVVERTLILMPKGPLAFDQLNLVQQNAAIGESKKTDVIEKLDDAISSHIRRALTESKGRIHGVGGAADLLGINPNTLRSRMKKLGIEHGKKDAVR